MMAEAGRMANRPQPRPKVSRPMNAMRNAESQAEQRDHHEVDQIGEEPAAERALGLTDCDHRVGTPGRPLWRAVRSIGGGKLTSHASTPRVSNFQTAPARAGLVSIITS